jgi:hypothetical protein
VEDVGVTKEDKKLIKRISEATEDEEPGIMRAYALMNMYLINEANRAPWVDRMVLMQISKEGTSKSMSEFGSCNMAEHSSLVPNGKNN